MRNGLNLHEIHEQETAEAFIEDFAETAPPNTGTCTVTPLECNQPTDALQLPWCFAGCALMLWAAAGTGCAEDTGESAVASTCGAALDAAVRVASGRVGCLALWKESDGRSIHRLYPGASDDEDPPLLGSATALDLVRALRARWGGTVECCGGEQYAGAAPKKQMQRLVREMRRR